MAYTQNEKSTGLDLLTDLTLSQSDLHIVGDVSDSGRAKAITQNLLEDYIANSTNFVDELVANNYFTTELANDSNFITELNNTGTIAVAVDGVTITGDGTTGNPLVATPGGYSLDVQENAVSVETGVDTINFTGAVNVTNPSAGQVDVEILSSQSVILVNQLDDFLGGIGTLTSVNSFFAISTLNWNGESDSGNDIGNYIIGEINHPGIFRLEASGTNNAKIYLGDSTARPISQYAQSGNEYTFIVRCNDTTSQTDAAIIQLGNISSVFSSSTANNSIQIDFDTTNNNIIFRTRDGATTESTTVVTGFTAIFYNIKIVCNGTSVECYVDGLLEATHSTNVPSTSTIGSIQLMALNGEQLDIDLVLPTYQATR